MTFDTSLVEAVGSAIGDEARAFWNANGNGGGASLLCLSPVLNLARDPRCEWRTDACLLVVRKAAKRLVFLRKIPTVIVRAGGRSYESYGE